MSRASMILICTVMFLSFGDGYAAEEAEAEKKLEYAGTFVWNKKSRNIYKKKFPLKAILTPDGKGKWHIEFSFTWEKKPHVFTGSLNGDLKDGAITGFAERGKGKMRWTFSGAASKGAIFCEHRHVLRKNRGARTTGTFELHKTTGKEK